MEPGILNAVSLDQVCVLELKNFVDKDVDIKRQELLCPAGWDFEFELKESSR